MTEKINTQQSLKVIILLPLLVTIFFLYGNVTAQPKLAFKSYSTQEGLSHDIVRRIISDKQGFLWIATSDGLNKFNSHTFEIFRKIPGDSNSIAANHIFSLALDKYGNIWAGTWGGGLCVYNRKLNNFLRINDIASPTLFPNYITDLYLDSQNRMWMGTANNGIFLVDQDTYQLEHYPLVSENTDNAKQHRISSITEGSQGKLWIGTQGSGLLLFDPETKKNIQYLHDNDNPNSLSSNQIYKVFYDSQQRLWVGTYNHGLNLQKNNGDFIHFTHNPDNPGSIINNQIWAINETPDGSIWVGTDNGLALFHEESQQFSVYQNDPFDPKSIGSNPVKDLYTDPDGRLWIGCYRGGLSVFDKSFIQFQHFYAEKDRNSISHNTVRAFHQSKDGQVLIGTDGGGLNIFDLHTGKFVHYTHNHNVPSSIGNDKLLDIVQDDQERIWLGFWTGGIDYFDEQQQAFIHYRKELGYPHGPSSNNVTSLAKDQDGYIWVCTFDGGVNRLDPNTKKFEYFFHDRNDPNSISNNQIWSILVDSKNNVWLGAGSGILNLFERKSGSFQHINIKEPDESYHSIEEIFEDSKGQLWIGLEGGGLKKLNPRDKSVKTYTLEDGLPSNSVLAVEEDQQGNLWLSTHQGLTRFNPVTEQFTNFDTSDGLQSLNFTRNAAILLSSGEMLFGGINGFNRFHPDSVKVYAHKTPIVFTGFQIFNQPVPIGEKNSPLQAHINELDTITLLYSQSVFSIEYAALSFTAPEKVSYRYRLKGFLDESWQKAGKERKVTYTNLQPGNYLFEVARVDSTTQQPARALSIIITPPWWQTWWARLLLGMVLAIIVITVYNLRLKNIREQNKKLEKEVAERTVSLKKANDSMREKNKLIQEQNSELIDKNKLIQEQKEEIQAQAEELQESNETIQLINHSLEERVELRTIELKKSNQELDNFVYRVSHDIRAPLSSVLGLLALIENENDPTTIAQYLEMATKSINKLDGFVKDILSYSQNARMQLNIQPIDFSQLIENCIDELQYMSNGQRIKIDTTLPENNDFCSDPKRLHVIFRNILSNAIKYQNLKRADPFVKIDIHHNEKGAHITVKDNGIGISAAQLEKVFDMFYRGSEISTGSGIGLYIVKETVETLGGHINLQSEVAEGTTFNIHLPNLNHN